MVDLVPKMAAELRQAYTLTPSTTIPQKLKHCSNTNSQPRNMWMESKARTPEEHEASKQAQRCYNA